MASPRLADKLAALTVTREPAAGDVWTLVHDGERPPTTNWTRGQASHWSQLAAKTKEWRYIFWARAKEAKVPHIEVVEFEVIPLHKDLRSPQDTGACAPAAKAAIDGIVCALDGRPWDSKQVDDGPHRVIGVTYRPPACAVGVDGLMIVVRAVKADHRAAPDGVKWVVAPVSEAVTTMLTKRVGRIDPRLWGIEAGRLLSDAVEATGPESR